MCLCQIIDSMLVWSGALASWHIGAPPCPTLMLLSPQCPIVSAQVRPVWCVKSIRTSLASYFASECSQRVETRTLSTSVIRFLLERIPFWRCEQCGEPLMYQQLYISCSAGASSGANPAHPACTWQQLRPHLCLRRSYTG